MIDRYIIRSAGLSTQQNCWRTKHPQAIVNIGTIKHQTIRSLALNSWCLPLLVVRVAGQRKGHQPLSFPMWLIALRLAIRLCTRKSIGPIRMIYTFLKSGYRGPISNLNNLNNIKTISCLAQSEAEARTRLDNGYGRLVFISRVPTGRT